MGDLTQHFNKREFFSEKMLEYLAQEKKDPRELLDERLLVRLELIRSYFILPVHINSGYRSYDENITTKGSSRFSQHMFGRAADIVVERIDPKEVQLFIQKNFYDGGLGCYPDFTHIDTRWSKQLISWRKA